MGFDQKTMAMDGKVYAVSMLPAKRGARLFVKTMRLFAPGMAAMADPNLRKQDVASERFASAIGQAFAAADDNSFDEVLSELMATVEEDGRAIKDTWSVQFAGNLLKLFKVVAFAIGAHFGDFQKGFAELSASAEASTPKANA